ncbi:MAG: hypothetical protein E6X21_01395 [Clostridium sp.]|nr:hypothetical protein [Clostridium sp.]
MLNRKYLPSHILEKMSDLIDESYIRYKDDMINRERRPKLLGKNIYIDEKTLYDGKENGFWHCSSMGKDDAKFDQYPCENDITKSVCQFRCNINAENNFLRDKDRVPCVYRADRSIWIKEIIELVNENKLNNIKMWKYKDNRKKVTDFKIWYDDGDISYIVIFQIKYTENKSDILKYIFKSAYPVVLKSYRKRFLKEFNESKK